MIKFIVLMLLSFNLCAASVMVEHSVYTSHLPAKYEYNNDNRLLGIEYKKSNWYFNAAKFDNSFYIKSISLGSGYNVYSIHGIDLDILFGGVTGYSEGVPEVKLRMPCVDDVCFYAAPRISYSLHVAKRFYLTASVKVFGTSAIVAIGVKYAL